MFSLKSELTQVSSELKLKDSECGNLQQNQYHLQDTMKKHVREVCHFPASLCIVEASTIM